MDRTEWLSKYEQEISNLLSRWYSRFEFNPVAPCRATYRFFAAYGSMRDAMWTNAHFRCGYIYTVEQAAALWFNECVLPMLKEEKQKVWDETLSLSNH